MIQLYQTISRLHHERFQLSESIKSFMLDNACPKKLENTKKNIIAPNFQSIDMGELQIRKLVEWNSTWEVLEPYCIELFRLSQDLKHLSQTIELCFLYGDKVKLACLLDSYKTYIYEAFLLIQSHVRAHILFSLKKNAQDFSLFRELISLSILRKDFSDTDAFELLLIFEYLVEEKNLHKDSFYIFEKNELSWVILIQNMGSEIGCTLDDIYVLAAKSSYYEGLYEKSLIFSKRISKNSIHYKIALDIAYKIYKEEKLLNQNYVIHKIKSAHSSKEQLHHIESYIKSIHENSESFDVLAINQWLNQPFSILQQDPLVWRRFSEILLFYSQDKTPIKNILKPFRRSLDSESPLGLLISFWSFRSDLLPINEKHIFRSFQLFFEFVLDPKQNEDCLWESFFSFEDSSSFEITWNTLKERFIDGFKNRRWKISEEDRYTLITKLSVATETPSIQDISEYIKISSCRKRKPLDFLYEKIKNKNYPSILAQILLKKGQLSYFINQDLKNLIKTQDKHASWSSISILKSRHAMPFLLEEKKSGIFLSPVKLVDSHLCTYDFPQEYKKLSLLITQIGPQFPLLLSSDNVDFPSKVKQLAMQEDIGPMYEDVFKKTFKQSNIFENFCGFFTIKKNETQKLYHQLLPVFCQELKKEEPWFEALTFIYHFLGFHAWESDLSYLKKTALESPYYEICKSKKMTAKEKISIKELWSCVKSIRNEDLQEAHFYLWVFVSRLTLLFFNHPEQALDSLQKAQTDYLVIRKLENFILSKPYEIFQKSQKVHYRDIPKTILTCL